MLTTQEAPSNTEKKPRKSIKKLIKKLNRMESYDPYFVIEEIVSEMQKGLQLFAARISGNFYEKSPYRRERTYNICERIQQQIMIRPFVPIDEINYRSDKRQIVLCRDEQHFTQPIRGEEFKLFIIEIDPAQSQDEFIDTGTTGRAIITLTDEKGNAIALTNHMAPENVGYKNTGRHFQFD